ncbi:MAG TPA: NADH-quinone oxidoreductase subunit L, partial [Microthrixaceae bacterium]|nr:NADH-quinone oxidoreductase subunit L [Microthrixaceae bacterium]
MDLIWLIPALPLYGFVMLVLMGRKFGDPKAGWFASILVGGSFIVTLKVFFDMLALPASERVFTQELFTWMPSGSFDVSFGFMADPLSILMCLFITGIGALIHIYSIGYMKGDENYTKFFLYLNLFIASMLLLVLGNNLLLTFLGWEGVGLCSYLLISFWHTDMANSTAAKKAFVVNRIGDFGFMVGTFWVWVTVGSINYVDIKAYAPLMAGTTATVIALLFFLAAAGKSAQLPLYVWLPDAMAGPTPVSALMHAATMVTAGVYLLTRLNPIMAEAGWANDVVAWVGVVTALVAASIAIAQTDIKKVLAYSTVSQLGYMFLAVGTQNYVGAVFHMVTHAFFKALLFLGSGSVITQMAHDQDMRHYGNLRKYMPITAGTFIVGWLAIAGVPPLSGFWSKDEILAGAFNAGPAGPALWLIGLIVALMTAFYMTRQVIMTFFGEEKWREEPAEDSEDANDSVDDHHHGLTPSHEPHESPATMTVPLLILAGAAVIAGLLNLPFTSKIKYLGDWLHPVIVDEHHLPSAPVLFGLASGAVTCAIVGIGLGYLVYSKRRFSAEKIELPVLAAGWHIDETYSKLADGPGTAVYQGLADFDSTVIDGAVNGVGSGTLGLARLIRPLQSGLVRNYALGIG